MKPEGTSDTPPVIGAVTEAREVTPFDKCGIALVAFGMSPLVVGWILLFRREFEMGEFIAINILGLFSLTVIETFSIILLWGLGRLELPQKIVHWLGMATVGEVAGMLLIIIKYVFPNDS